MQSSTIKQLQLAAEGGDAAAQFNLGVLYDSRLDDNGYPIEGNRAEAVRWLLAAAEQGLPRAQSQLATMYAGGPDAPPARQPEVRGFREGFSRQLAQP